MMGDMVTMESDIKYVFCDSPQCNYLKDKHALIIAYDTKAPERDYSKIPTGWCAIPDGAHPIPHGYPEYRSWINVKSETPIYYLPSSRTLLDGEFNYHLGCFSYHDTYVYTGGIHRPRNITATLRYEEVIFKTDEEIKSEKMRLSKEEDEKYNKKIRRGDKPIWLDQFKKEEQERLEKRRKILEIENS